MVLSKEEFLSTLKGKIGEDNSDDTIKFLEDMTDTYNDLEQKSSGSVDWEKKYNDLDKSWRDKYTKRFFDAPADRDDEPHSEGLNDGDAENTPTKFSELFTEKGE